MAFPTNLDSFSTKTSGQTISESHVNDLQTAIVAVETKIGYGADTPVSGDFFKGTGTGTTGWSALASSDLPAGSIVQIVNTQTGAVDTGSTVFPNDDTIPQNDEGDEYMTLAITPTNASNKLKIDVVVCGSSGENSYTSMAALFQDSTANALAAVSSSQGETPNGTVQLILTYYMTAGTISETTFKIRAGHAAGTTWTFNGVGGARKNGGVMSSSMTITEIAV
uniref:Uncharacterized protein n=1 Tax=viral metagenome TaxID=1070528 RepID=A0A6M3JBN1_9ZZZZ